MVLFLQKNAKIQLFYTNIKHLKRTNYYYFELIIFAEIIIY